MSFESRQSHSDPLFRKQACESRSAFGIADLTADLQGPEFGKNMPTKFCSLNSSSL